MKSLNLSSYLDLDRSVDIAVAETNHRNSELSEHGVEVVVDVRGLVNQAPSAVLNLFGI